MAKVILVVDPDERQLQELDAALTADGHKVVVAASGAAAVTVLNSDKADQIDLMVLELLLPDMSGIEVLRDIRPRLPQLPVIVATAQNSLDTVVQVMRAGASDFVARPASLTRLRLAIDSALELSAVSGEITRIKGRFKGPASFDSLVGTSETMARAVEFARKGAVSNIPILIEGESGVGKEMFARAIQAVSDRADKSFVAVNCGAIPENLVESILFGHEKGAFTGATEKHDGKFVEANGGTLFLDEIGELPMEIQVKLLRAIQEGEVDPVGGRKPVKVDIRLISATNKTLIERVKEGMFREDLLYRLNVFPIRIPPLRERPEDIPLLVQHFATMLAEGEGRAVREVTPRALELLQTYNWPGNVRQLENAIFRAVILADGDLIDVEDFPQILNAMNRTADGALPGPKLVVSSGGTIGEASPGLARPVNGDAAPAADLQLVDADGHIRPLAEIEGDVIRLAMTKYNGHMSEIARRLGIGRSTLYRKVDDLGLQGFPHAINGGKAS